MRPARVGQQPPSLLAHSLPVSSHPNAHHYDRAIMEFTSPIPLPPIPDDVTLQKFLMELDHVAKPHRGFDIPLMIDPDTGRRVTWHEVQDRSLHLANGLFLKYGLRRDDVVLIVSRNHVDFPIITFAVHKLGGIVSGANPDFSADELSYITQESKSTLLIVHPDCLDRAIQAASKNSIPLRNVVLLEAARSSSIKGSFETIDGLISYSKSTRLISFTEIKFAPGEAKTKIACLSFSSGTTGRPKAVALSHFGLVANVVQFSVHHKMNRKDLPPDSEERRYRVGDVVLGILPFFHIYGLSITIFVTFFAGMTLVVVPKFGFTDMLKIIQTYRVSHLYIVPPIALLLCKDPAVKRYDLSSIRFMLSGAAPLSHELQKQLQDTFPRAHIGQAFGMTETTTAVTMFSIENRSGVPGGSGILMPGVTARVVKPDGTLAGYDEVGEIWIKSPSIALRYTNDKEATEETFVDGWVRTGDQVTIDRHGEVRVMDRLKEMIKARLLPRHQIASLTVTTDRSKASRWHPPSSKDVS
ncbi:phenylacetyl-CoA ligase, variant 2 [Coprinopsis cinerea AmutBmut pab1-1]|nr:phenylacetyl-CoA ligase, variant 2 [Coprinopsis cinerea AmutBmut pab1-1]